MSESDVAVSLDFSVERLARDNPDFSARILLSRRQRLIAIAAVLAVIGGAVYDLVDTAIGVLSLLTAMYLATTVNRVVLYVRSRRTASVLVVSDEEARAVPDELLPVYSVLVPAYREPEVLPALLRHLDQLEYPRHKLDVKLLLEADDEATVAAARRCDPGDHVELVLVPPSGPRTKPKALDYALPLVRGSVVTIYDAEDVPDPLQLRKAAIALGRAGPEVACVQALLSFGNSMQNLITQWFTIEYAMWYTFFLPGLSAIGAPLPLGGTSNHFHTDTLVELGAWDPNNVTEDADLGIRLARLGYRCEVLDSTTLEEANSDFVNWVKQRSRWYKGYLQTTLVHLRHPTALRREIGLVGIGQLIMFVMGTPLLAFINGTTWLLTVLWFAVRPEWIHRLFPAVLFYPALACWILGNFVIAYLTLLTCKLTRRSDLFLAAVLVPAYWAMMSLAAIKAFWQLVTAPTFWEKTVHGLTRDSTPAAAGPGSPR